jgi:hypothetical protein
MPVKLPNERHNVRWAWAICTMLCKMPCKVLWSIDKSCGLSAISSRRLPHFPGRLVSRERSTVVVSFLAGEHRTPVCSDTLENMVIWDIRMTSSQVHLQRGDVVILDKVVLLLDTKERTRDRGGMSLRHYQS